ncbi:MAG: metallophosphoesterase [Oscillospiraceae bacterium]|nr:metallophosphoesterase [Oscillospiraceae bacterium]
MALYAIGDLHLSLQTDKPMDVFRGWTDYVERLREGFSQLTDEDTTVLLGDVSWAMGLDHAERDFSFISDIPGRKIILKGNHDYWWSTAKKFHNFCAAHGFDNMFLLNNNCYEYGDIAICGTRGWFYEEEQKGSHDEKIFLREMQRLEASLRAAGDREKICFLHYPPRYRDYICPEVETMLKHYGVKQCCYGHLHGDSRKSACEGEINGLFYRLVSADHLGFRPARIL